MANFLKIGVILVPLLVFVILFGSNMMETFYTNAGDSKGQADALKNSADGAAWN